MHLLGDCKRCVGLPQQADARIMSDRRGNKCSVSTLTPTMGDYYSDSNSIVSHLWPWSPSPSLAAECDALNRIDLAELAAASQYLHATAWPGLESGSERVKFRFLGRQWISYLPETPIPSHSDGGSSSESRAVAIARLPAGVSRSEEAVIPADGPEDVRVILASFRVPQASDSLPSPAIPLLALRTLSPTASLRSFAPRA